MVRLRDSISPIIEEAEALALSHREATSLVEAQVSTLVLYNKLINWFSNYLPTSDEPDSNTYGTSPPVGNCWTNAKAQTYKCWKSLCCL